MRKLPVKIAFDIIDLSTHTSPAEMSKKGNIFEKATSRSEDSIRKYDIR